MARVQVKKTSFARGVISEKIADRDDLELYGAGLADGENYIVDGRAGLEKRPGTMHIGATKNNGFATLLPFAYSRRQAYAIEAGDGYFRFYVNYSQLVDGSNDPVEVETPYLEEDVERISNAQSNDIVFLACPGYKHARLSRTSATSFELNNFDLFDGPYLDMNPIATQMLAVVGTTVTATGFAPFTAGMVGRWIRIRTANTDSSDANELGDEFLWAIYQITAFTSSTVVEIDQSDADIVATPDWRMGAFYEDNWPEVVAIHQGRLVFAAGPRVWLSKPQDFNNFNPTYLDAEGGATGRVQPDSSISIVIDSGLSNQGGVTQVLWMKSQNFQLVLGTPVGIITIQSTSLGEALTPENAVVRIQDSRGASETMPVTVTESTIFVHTTGNRLQGTYYKDGSFDRIGAQDLSLASDTLVTDQIRRLAWQDFPHGVVYQALTDGHLLALSLQPEEKVQGWYPQRMGGSYINQGALEHPHVEAVLTLPAPDGKRDDVWKIVKRTIDGEERRYVEVGRNFWSKGRDVRDSWYLDSALRYEGNVDLAKAITLTTTGGGDPNLDWTITTNFSDPELQPATKFSFHDGRRWHRGTIIEVDGDNNALWRPAAPNAPPGRADGLRWFYDADPDDPQAPGVWVQATRDAPAYFRPTQPTYEAPAAISSTWRWSIAVSRLAGLDHLVGETVQGLVDGVPTLPAVVDADGEIDFGVEGCMILVGLPYESTGKLLAINEGAQAGTADEKQRPVYSTLVSVWETWGLECGSGTISTYNGGTWEQFEQTIFPQSCAEGEPPPLFTGYKRFPRSSQGDAKNPSVAFRHRAPLPCYVRAIVNRISTSDGA
jgi:hypothetical protein